MRAYYLLGLNMNEREQAVEILYQVCMAVIETVNETPNGAPCGPVYMALLKIMPSMTALQFNTLIAQLEKAGKLQRRGSVLYPAPAYYTEPARHGL